MFENNCETYLFKNLYSNSILERCLNYTFEVYYEHRVLENISLFRNYLRTSS